LIDFDCESKPISNDTDAELDSKPLPEIVKDGQCCLDGKSIETETIDCSKVDIPTFHLSATAHENLALPYNLKNTVVAITECDFEKNAAVRKDPQLSNTVVLMEEACGIDAGTFRKDVLNSSTFVV
jgi:hypothetical protein